MSKVYCCVFSEDDKGDIKEMPHFNFPVEDTTKVKEIKDRVEELGRKKCEEDNLSFSLVKIIGLD